VSTLLYYDVPLVEIGYPFIHIDHTWSPVYPFVAQKMVSRPGHHARTLSYISIKSITPSDVKSFLVPLSILLGIAAASAAQTEVAHSLVVDQKYNQPYWTFFLTHTSFALVCPIHLVILSLIHRIPISAYIDDIRAVISNQLGEDHHTPWSGIAWKWTIKIAGLTWLISLPALAWFVAMLFTSALDVTAIYASSAFFAYFFSMILLKQPLSRVTLGSIFLAFAGVLVISLAGDGDAGDRAPSNRSMGDIIMLIGKQTHFLESLDTV
jgi:drug/metabolite transporter (DMT)-like permease